MRRWVAFGVGIAAAAALAAAEGHAADRAVDLELVLAVDASRSIDEDEYDLQRQGYMKALANERVLSAIRAGPLGAVAICYVEWSSETEQTKVVDWMLIKDRDSAAVFVASLAKAPRFFNARTSISGAIDYSLAQFAGNGFEGTRRVIDVSGDGVNNRGRPVNAARDQALEAGVTINGLVIINDRPEPWQTYPVALDRYFRDNVIGGPGAFLVVVKDFESFGEAITRKLIIEISGEPAAPDGNRQSRLSGGSERRPDQ